MFPQQWTPPCGSQCTKKYAALTQIPWRVFCKKGCDADGDTWEEWHQEMQCEPQKAGYRCMLDAWAHTHEGVFRVSDDVHVRVVEGVEECNEICYKDPVFKDQQWSAFIDRSPGSEDYSKVCFQACVSGCGYKLGIPSETVDVIQPKRPPKPCVEKKPPPPSIPAESIPTAEEMACNSA
ncbi:uncharacterized protein LOC113287693 isoform X1 [Papaver somniferum]|uniref:uncharacterized protein LOC113287693 isoform X1 n=1 Tax=Papaver somniferum TaxID=3469 RepID=UPI000E705531|nr:uncharacterized protein LOC113287693 isoform X1 [Papaver somniferum]